MFNVVLFTDAPYPHHKIRGYGVHRIASHIRLHGYSCLVVDFSSALTFDLYRDIIDQAVGPDTLMVGFSTTWLPYRWPEKPGEFTNQIPGHYIGKQHELSHLKQEKHDWRKDNLVVKFGKNERYYYIFHQYELYNLCKQIFDNITYKFEYYNDVITVYKH